MDVAIFLAVLLPPILLPILLALLIRDRSQPRVALAKWEQVAPSLLALGAEDRGRRRMSLTHKGVEWTLHLIRGDGVDLLTIQRDLALDPGGRPRHPGVTLVQEGALHRLYKRVLPDAELQLGEPSFDRRVFISRSTNSQATRDWLHHPRVQQGVVQLFSTDCRKVGTGIRLLPWGPPVAFGATFGMSSSWTTPAGFTATLDALQAICDGIPPAAAPARSESSAGVRIHLLLIAWVLVTFFAQIELQHHWWPMVEGLWKVAVGLFAPLYGIAGVAALFLTRQRIVRLHGACAILFYGWFAQSMAAGAVAATYNGYGDPTEQSYTVTVEARYTTESESGTHHKVRLSPLPDFPDIPHDRVIPKFQYDRAKEGDRCIVQAGRGKLAIPWRRLTTCSFFSAEDDS